MPHQFLPLLRHYETGSMVPRAFEVQSLSTCEQPVEPPLSSKTSGEFAEDSTRWCSHTSATTQASWLAGQQPFTGAGTAQQPKEHLCDSDPLPRGCTGKPKRAERALAAPPCSRLAPESRALCRVGRRALNSTKSRGLQRQVHKAGDLFTSSLMRKKFPYTVLPAMQG